MNKTFFTAALAGVLAFCGIALSAEETTKSFAVKMDLNLKENLTGIANRTDTEFGFKKSGSDEFFSLSDYMSSAKVEDNTATVNLGSFAKGDAIKFGFENTDTGAFEAANIRVASDPNYSFSYNPDSFFSLDFEKEASDGNIEIYMMGAPLPRSTVTLLVGLGAAAAFLLYNDRRRRMRCSERA